MKILFSKPMKPVLGFVPSALQIANFIPTKKYKNNKPKVPDKQFLYCLSGEKLN